MYLYKQAVEQAETTDSTAVAEALVGQAFDGPTGRMEVLASRHVRQSITLARVNGDGYEIVETFEDLDPESACRI